VPTSSSSSGWCRTLRCDWLGLQKHRREAVWQLLAAAGHVLLLLSGLELQGMLV
jgi:hypothetical protein